MKEPKIRIFIVDDHQLVIDGITELLGEVSEFEFVGSASNGKELLEKLKHIPTDLILMDIRMPEMNGFEATEIIRKRFSQIRILMLTMHSARKYIREATQKGADGYISKTKGKKDFIEAIRRVHAGEFVVMVDIEEDYPSILNKAASNEIQLSTKEKEILCYIINEYTTTEIAKALFRSPHTIERHRKNIMNKLGVKNIAGMVRYGVEHNVCDNVPISIGKTK